MGVLVRFCVLGRGTPNLNCAIDSLSLRNSGAREGGLSGELPRAPGSLYVEGRSDAEPGARGVFEQASPPSLAQDH